MPERKQKEFVSEYGDESKVAEEEDAGVVETQKQNQLKGEGGMIINPPVKYEEINFVFICAVI